jgi:hypothetical protein
MEGVTGSIPVPPTTETQQNQHECGALADDVPASSCLNKPRTVPKCPKDLGTTRARRSRKVPEEPPVQKRSPASPASENGAKRNNQSSPRHNTKARSASQDSECRFLWLTRGATNLGFIEQAGDVYKALGNDERVLGSFSSLQDAADAVDAAFNGSASVPLSKGSSRQVGNLISAGGVE